MLKVDNAKAEHENNTLRLMILQDQLQAIRQSGVTSIPINIVISTISLFVALHTHHHLSGIIWFAAATSINLIRFAQSWATPGLPQAASPAARHIQRQLNQLSLTALISGVIWAFMPLLADGYTSPQTVFFLTVTCGISAGAITYGTAYARVPIFFILPPLLSTVGFLVHAGGLSRLSLAVTVLIYAAALVRSGLQSEAVFREASLLKNRAIALAHSLEEAHGRAVLVAEQMGHRAEHDELTNLFNRSGFLKEMEKRISGSHAKFCLMMVDLDGFKSVNDVFGHLAGDRVLTEVARRLGETLGCAFTLARLGGDEFAVFYDTSEADMFPAELATRLIASLAVPFPNFDAGRVGACIGLYTGRDKGVTEFLTCADQALHAAKSAGRNQFYIFDDELRYRLDMRRDVERDLLRALEDAAPQVWYQPILAEDGKKLAGLEALLRWRHPQHGMVPPQDLIDIAAKAGLAEPLLRRIIAEICVMIRELRARGYVHVRVALNLSPREISRLAVDEILLSELKIQNCPTTMLEVEITEETVLDIRSVQDKLIRLAGSGVQITIDDFGVGYSTLATLRQPYVSRIKIDRSFVKDIAQSQGNQILVQSILNLGRSLGLEVVAEGVETEEDLSFLRGAGCTLMQGYYFQRPAPLSTMLPQLPLRLG